VQHVRCRPRERGDLVLFPGATQRATLHRRPGIVTNSECGMAPDQRSGVKNAAPHPGHGYRHGLILRDAQRHAPRDEVHPSPLWGGWHVESAANNMSGGGYLAARKAQRSTPFRSPHPAGYAGHPPHQEEGKAHRICLGKDRVNRRTSGHLRGSRAMPRKPLKIAVKGACLRHAQAPPHPHG
jgi:hypothetical protein